MRNKTVVGMTVLLVAWIAFGTMGYLSENVWRSCVTSVCVCEKNDQSVESNRMLLAEPVNSLQPADPKGDQAVTVESSSQSPCTTLAQEVILSKYNSVENTISDIHEHIPVIYKYVEMFPHATEIGVRTLGSSWAFAKAGMDRIAAGKPFTYRAIDITKQGVVDQLDKAMLGCPSVQYSFTEGDDLLIDPWKTDVLLIDTWHVYRQLAAELPRWAPFVRHYILLHDTESFRGHDDGVEWHGGKAVDERLFSLTSNRGLWPAVEQFVAAHPEWSIHEHKANNNGLTVLKRAENTFREEAEAASSFIETVKNYNPVRVSEVARDSQPEKEFQPVQDSVSNTRSKIKTEVVMFIPSPVPWEDRRQLVYRQFEQEGWTLEKAALVFIFGTRAGYKLQDSINTSGVVKYPRAVNVDVYCRDQGDEYDNPDDTSGTTCKVYEALKYIAANYEAKYVWRGADDSYVNLRYFFSNVMPTIPTTRLYLGRLFRVDKPSHDGKSGLLLSFQPRLQELFGIYQFGQYMSGMGYMLSYDVADFVASLKIPPHLTWCEDLMVGMWLNPFQIKFMHHPGLHEQSEQPADLGKDYLLVHRMTVQQWQRIDDTGKLY